MLPRRTKRHAVYSRLERRAIFPAAAPTLELLCNGKTHQEMSLDRPRLLIGRSDKNDLTIPSRYVSRHHILLVRHGTSTILIDLESTNGTLVNSTRVFNHVLADGDEISIDQQSLFVQYSIKYYAPATVSRETSGVIESAAGAIRKALAEIRPLLSRGGTDFLPTLREDVPTLVGIIDDR
jgi:predicted component of type VI protein secretion system